MHAPPKISEKKGLWSITSRYLCLLIGDLNYQIIKPPYPYPTDRLSSSLSYHVSFLRGPYHMLVYPEVSLLPHHFIGEDILTAHCEDAAQPLSSACSSYSTQFNSLLSASSAACFIVLISLLAFPCCSAPHQLPWASTSVSPDSRAMPGREQGLKHSLPRHRKQKERKEGLKEGKKRFVQIITQIFQFRQGEIASHKQTVFVKVCVCVACGCCPLARHADFKSILSEMSTREHKQHPFMSR